MTMDNFNCNSSDTQRIEVAYLNGTHNISVNSYSGGVGAMAYEKYLHKQDNQ